MPGIPAAWLLEKSGYILHFILARGILLYPLALEPMQRKTTGRGLSVPVPVPEEIIYVVRSWTGLF